MSTQKTESEKYANDHVKGLLSNSGIALEGQVLGAGAFSVVFSGSFAGGPCAIKISKEPLAAGRAILKESSRGCEIWPLTRKHEFINTLLWNGVFPLQLNGEEHLCTIWERAETSLDKFELTSFSELHALLRNISSAIRFLHGKNVVHRDIKPANILIVKSADGRNEAQLADLGLARLNSASGNVTVCGTPRYVHPRRPGTPEHDIYSFCWLYLDLVARISGHSERSDETVKDFGKAKEYIESLPIPESVRELCTKIVVLDTEKPVVNLGNFVDEIGKHLETETTYGDHGGNGFEFDSLYMLNRLASHGFNVETTLDFVGSAVGTTAKDLPAILRQNADIVAAFRAKELAYELISFVDSLRRSVDQMQDAIRSYEDTDNEMVLKKPVTYIRSVNFRLRDRLTNDGQHSSRYKEIVNELFELTDKVVTEIYRIESPAQGYSVYAQRLNSYSAIADVLSGGLLKSLGSVRGYYTSLCDLLDNATVT